VQTILGFLAEGNLDVSVGKRKRQHAHNLPDNGL
jgi:hypothetical protein